MEILKKGGALRFWGDWFGRPYDNYHIPVSAEFSGEMLTINFNSGEKCTVYDPSDIVNKSDDFHVARASKIIWEWYFYGREQTPENLCKREYSNVGDAVSIAYAGERTVSKDSADVQNYALELC